MEFLYFLERIRVPGLNEFMSVITYLGSETAFLIIALTMFWCIDKRRGYYILSVGFIGTIINQFMKLTFRIPRPFEVDPNFTILESARADATGFSFPSGHTQSSVGTFGGIAYTTAKRTTKILMIAIAILVPFSRMYVGVHTPQDVLVAAAIAIALILVVKPVVYKHKGKFIPVMLGFMTLLAIAYLCYVTLIPAPTDVTAERWNSGIESAYTLFGALIGLLFVYAIDEKWLNFPTKAMWWAQIIKVVLGLGVVLLVKSGLKPILNALCGEYLGRSVRYFLVVIFAGIIWPLTFRLFEKSCCKE